MTGFTEDEQWYSDLDWYAVDKEGNIGQFLTGGHRLLPPSLASNKQASEKLSDYFDSLPVNENDFTFCPNLERNSREKLQISKDFMPFSQKMASRGLFSYDSDNFIFYKNRPYYRVAIPKSRLQLADLPQEIRDILENLRLEEISFAEDSLIPEEVINKLWDTNQQFSQSQNAHLWQNSKIVSKGTLLETFFAAFMVEHFIYTENGVSFEALAGEVNRSWGKGVAIQIIGSDGAVRNRVTFVVHPEFPRFDEYQSLTFKDLLDEAKAQLNSGQLTVSLSDVAEDGLELFVALNDKEGLTNQWTGGRNSYSLNVS